MWGLFSKDPAKDFAFETGDQIGQVISRLEIRLDR